jgi:hypothetical protein
MTAILRSRFDCRDQTPESNYGCSGGHDAKLEAVDLRHQTAHPSQCLSVKADAIADCGEFLRRSARMLAASAANMDAKFGLERCEATFSVPSRGYCSPVTMRQ